MLICHSANSNRGHIGGSYHDQTESLFDRKAESHIRELTPDFKKLPRGWWCVSINPSSTDIYDVQTRWNEWKKRREL